MGQESTWAAEASECAGEQDKFWEYHDLLFNSQSGENQGKFNKENLKGFAGDLGLDQAKFSTCLDDDKFASLVQQQTQFAQQIGVRSTPSFVVNNQALVGAQPFEAFQQVIEAELKK